MNKIGRKIYFDKATGTVIQDKGEMILAGPIIETTVEQDFEIFISLQGRTLESVDFVQLEFGEFHEEFLSCSSYRVNPITKQIEFIHEENTGDLDGFKEMKIKNLKRICEETIEAGFVSAVNGHTYRTNRDDQSNFIGRKEYLNDHPDVTTVRWKTEDVGYIDHTREDWITIFYEGMTHKEIQLYKYDQLKQQVLASDSMEEIDAIN